MKVYLVYQDDDPYSHNEITLVTTNKTKAEKEKEELEKETFMSPFIEEREVVV